MNWNTPEVVAEVSPHGVGLLTLNRPKALNALSLPMVRALSAALTAWRDDPTVRAVAVRGSGKHGPFGAFCAGGDIRFFHQAATQGDPALEDFFTEEYALNHLIFTYPKPYLAFMDGIVMGGGMGISQGGSVRVVTEHTKMAMPETHIGLFPDVGGGYFLSRCPGHVGEYLALTGHVMGAAEAVAYGLADVIAPADRLPDAWTALQQIDAPNPEAFAAAWQRWMDAAGWVRRVAADAPLLTAEVEAAFGEASVPAIVAALARMPTAGAAQALEVLRTRSPLMLHVVLEQVRRARRMNLADDLRMERDLVRHCFQTGHLQRSGTSSETVEGIRALAVDKDHSPRWNPPRIEDVTPDMVAPFFVSPWPAHAHPLRALA
ncbi:enoyl-CoA hydratase/isomerase family protein [Aquabacterium sp. A08]|uniref:enoyl-CoA hydratase/isomerase family protein n=1 Tax=Aquabacterium sp. A08 TaxID=2718532 RepID=UPI001422DCBD|nr:enoyl-CoA hydratase/isomerase family protein [Aquabacterium sp. A08]NIC40803.1 enoyl-CoA hydratase/isomerase family protein [Aquabacterium sp. A08]NIC41851.1 enoyl-CoA hydratase/isomerase family protein [Aquabacterium sp. A08]